MKLRYYLRGLGIGIAVTALIMGLSDQDARPLTDAEIKAKAATLGMVESDSLRLADVSVTPEEESQFPEKESSVEPQPSDAEAEQPSPPPETGESDVDAFSGQEETVSITIEAGSGSGTVCRQLEEAGLIKSAATFDRYLIDNGYSKRISTGTYEIRIGSAEEEIAKIITKTR